MPGITGVLGAGGAVVVVVGAVVVLVVVGVVVGVGCGVVVVVLGVVVGGSSVTVPITQYSWLALRVPGQVVPGFSSWKSATDSPQLLAKLSHVAPGSGGVAKSQTTPRR
jgi:hypothetical protein